MGFDVNTKDSARNERAPYYYQTYAISYDLARTCQTVMQTLFYKESMHEVSHANPQLGECLIDLDRFLGDYRPDISVNLGSSLIVDVSRDGVLIGTEQGKERFKAAIPPSNTFIKNAAFSLREVLQHALKNKKDLVIW